MTRDPADDRLLEVLQRDIPLEQRPFESIAAECGLSESRVLERIAALLAGGLIREISGLLNARTLGYRSTLVAARVAEDDLSSCIDAVNAHPGVSHNYLRDHEYNIWFTLSLPAGQSMEEVVASLFRGVGRLDYLLLPAVRRFKLRVDLPVSEGTCGGRNSGGAHDDSGPPPDGPATPGPRASRRPTLDATDRALIRLLQEPFPLVAEPWTRIGAAAGLSTDATLAGVRRLEELGVLRRVSAVIRHRRLGYAANGMACFSVPAAKMEHAGRIAAAYQEVSHCYWRSASGPWPSPLFAMIHARSREACDGVTESIAGAIDCSDFQILYSVRELKKARVKYDPLWAE